MNRAWWIGALLVGLPGCARGCSTPPPAPSQPMPAHGPTRPVATPAVALPTAATAGSLAGSVETALGIQLPRRAEDAPFPGFATLPRRRLRHFRPERHLIAQLRGSQVIVLGHKVDADDADAVRAALRQAIEMWEQRSGIAATRLVLVIERRATPRSTSTLRRVAMDAHTWRVVALAREGERLMEVHLSPPGQRKR